jgi:hypothetical protein
MKHDHHPTPDFLSNFCILYNIINIPELHPW